MKLPPEITAALDAAGLPWAVEPGGKHYKIKVAGRLAGIYPKGKPRGAHKRTLLNTVTQVNNLAKEIKGTR
jgi:hypothetical protein